MFLSHATRRRLIGTAGPHATALREPAARRLAGAVALALMPAMSLSACGSRAGSPPVRISGPTPDLHGTRLIRPLREPDLQFPKPYRDGDRVRGIGHLRERLTAPQPQRLAQSACGVLDLAVPQRAPALIHQTLETQDVDGLRRQVKAVAAVRGAHRRLLRQGRPQPRHQRLQRMRRITRPVIRPQRLRLDGEHAAGVQRQPDQQRPQPGAIRRGRP